MARTKKQLVRECIVYGLPIVGTMDEVYDRLARHKCALQEVEFPRIIQPMLAHTYADKGLNPNTSYVLEEKIDGVRAIMYFSNGRVNVRLRGRSVKTYLPLSKEDNILWTYNLNTALAKEMDGLILDGELVSSKAELTVGKLCKTARAVTTALLNAEPALARAIQLQTDTAIRYHVFDILQTEQLPSVRFLPQQQRRAVLEDEVGARLWKLPFITLNPQAPIDQAERFFRLILERGGEGIMYKDVNAPYEAGKRSAAWLKRKRSIRAVGYVSGFVDATSGKRNEGLVGGITFNDEMGKPIATVSSLTDSTRETITTQSESGPALHPALYGKKALLVGFDWSRNGLLEHARLIKWMD